MKISMTSKQRKVYNEVKPQIQGWELDLHGTAWRDILRLRKLSKAGTEIALTSKFVQLATVLESDDPKTLADAVAMMVADGYDVKGWSGKEVLHRASKAELAAIEQAAKDAKAAKEKSAAETKATLAKIAADEAESKIQATVASAPKKPSPTAGLDSLKGDEKAHPKSGKAKTA